MRGGYMDQRQLAASERAVAGGEKWVVVRKQCETFERRARGAANPYKFTSIIRGSLSTSNIYVVYYSFAACVTSTPYTL